MSPGGGVQQDPTSSVPPSLLSSSATGLPPMSTFRGSGGGVAGPGPGGQVTPTGATGVVGVPTSSPAQALYCGSHSPAVGVPQPQTGDTLGKALASVSFFILFSFPFFSLPFFSILFFSFLRLTARFVRFHLLCRTCQFFSLNWVQHIIMLYVCINPEFKPLVIYSVFIPMIKWINI
jgi:hypothetical protein